LPDPTPDQEPLILSLLDERNRKFFQFGLWLLLTMALAISLLYPFIGAGQVRRVFAAFMILPTAGLSLWLARRRQMRAALLVLIIGSWLVVTTSAVFNGGVFAASMVAYPLLVATCGWVFGLRAAAALAALTIFAEGALTVAGAGGAISVAVAPPLWQWAVHALLLVATVSFVGFSIRAYDDRLGQIRALGRELGDKVRSIEAREKELEQQTLHYRTLLDAQSSAGLGLFIITDGRITYANEAVCRMLGYSREDMLALPSYTRLLHADDFQRVKLNHERRVRGESFENRYDIVVQTKSGERREAEITVAVIPESAPPAVLIILADITERKQVARELAHSREMFSHVFQSNPTAVAVSRLDDGRYLDINASHSRLFGWSREDAIGHNAVELGIWRSAAERERWAAELRTTGHLNDYQAELCNREGKSLSAAVTAEIFSLAGEPVVLSFVSDYTDLRQAEANLRQSEERFGRVFQASPVATIISRIEDGAYLDVNDAFTRLFGWERDEVLTTSALKIGIWPDPQARAQWIATLRGEGSVRDFETDLRTRHGDIRHCVVAAEFVDFGDEPCVLSLIHDVTDRRRAEEEVRQLNSQLEERVLQRTMELTEVNQELESFAYSVSHDLRAPLRGIDGFSRLLQEEYAPQLDDQGREYIARVRRAAQRMGILIDDLLELSRMTRQEMTRQPVNLSAISAEVIANLRLEQPERDVTVSIEPDCRTQGDPQLLRVLLENLLGNAWKYTRNKPDAEIGFGVEHKPMGDVFYVRDNGVGFDMAYANKLFSPFQRLHNATEFEGSGIGLASAWRVVRRHGGQIRAEAQPGLGTTFRFTLATALPDKNPAGSKR